MAMTSEAGRTSRPPVSPSWSGGPTRTTSIPSSSAARRAPATISPGARSPPMASTATGSGRPVASPRPARAPTTSRLRRPVGPCTTRSWGRPRAGPWRAGTAGTRCGPGGRAPSSRRAGYGSSPWMSFSWGRPSSITPQVGSRSTIPGRPRQFPAPRSGTRRTSRAAQRSSRGVSQRQACSFRLTPHIGHRPRHPSRQSGGDGELEQDGVVDQVLEIDLRRRPGG